MKAIETLLSPFGQVMESVDDISKSKTNSATLRIAEAVNEWFQSAQFDDGLGHTNSTIRYSEQHAANNRTNAKRFVGHQNRICVRRAA